MRFFLNPLSIIAAMVLAMGTANAQVQVVSAPPPLPPIACNKSTLTNKQFLEAFKSIVNHGDLRDIPFIEKTLQTKLTPQYEVKKGKQNIHHIFYNSNSIFDAPIYVHVDVHDDDDVQNSSNNLAVLRITTGPFFKTCLHVTEPQFDSYFGKFAHINGTDGPGFMATNPLSSIAKNGGSIGIGYYGFDISESEILIDNPSISQSKPTIKH